MTHCCKICGSMKPNEKFSGKRHRDHVCRECSKIDKSELLALEYEEEIFGFLNQSNISGKNMIRLQALATSNNPRVAEMAMVVMEVAKVKPYKKRRLKVLGQKRPDLLRALERSGLILAHYW